MLSAIDRSCASLHWLLGWVFAFLLVETSPAQSVSVAQKKPGSVFIYPELPEFDLTVDGEVVQWSVTDFWKKTVAAGTLNISGNPTTLSFDPGALGYFSLRLVAVKNGISSSEVVVTCAVLAPVTQPGPVTPFGIAAHFAQSWDVNIMDLMVKAGIYRLRDENHWDQIEKTTPGTYLFPNTYTNYMAAAATRGIEPLMALTFANSNNLGGSSPYYDGGFTPYTDLGRTGYANYASRVVTQYITQIKEVEIWNEYNGSFVSGPVTNDRPASYARMLKKTAATLRAAHPNVKIGGGAAVLVPIPWFDNLFQQPGALADMDALVVHPYRGIPEGVENEIAALKQLTRDYNGGFEKPIWVTECGTYSPDAGRQSMARYLVRLMTLLRSEGVERISWYLLKDEQSFVSGLLYSDTSSFGKNAPSTGYVAYATLIRLLGDATIVGREATDLRTRMYRFSKNGTQLRVVWSTSGASSILAQTNETLVVTDIMGNTRMKQPVNGYVSLPVNEDPFYISGNITSLQEVGRDQLLADSAAGYSEVQGGAPGTWLYGYEVNSVPNPPFQLLNLVPTAYGYRWQGNYYAQSLQIDNGHPSAAYDLNPQVPVPTIRRWLSNVSGPINIQGYSRRSAPGFDGTGIAVRIDGVTIYTRLVGPSRDDIASFSLRANVNIGSKVDFMINPGPGIDVNNDAIDYLLQISEPFAAGDPDGEPGKDPDGDGLNNQLENALGSNSRKADSAEFAPKLLLSTHADNQKYLHFQYHALKAPAGTTYEVQSSTNLIDWQPGTGTTVTLQDAQDGTWLREYQETSPVANGGKQFLRLHVTTP